MDNFKTSQKEWSLSEGNSSAGAPAVQYGTPGTGPGAVTEPIKGEIKKIDALQTSQQRANQHHLPEASQ